MGDTNLAQTIWATNDSDSAYDTNVKCLLADKQILSWILKFKKSGNKLIAMLEELLSRKDVVKKKHILESEYGMIMTEELEGRMQSMCNLSELVKEGAVKNERIEAIKRMIKADATKEQIISFGYTEEEIEKAESALYANV